VTRRSASRQTVLAAAIAALVAGAAGYAIGSEGDDEQPAATSKADADAKRRAAARPARYRLNDDVVEPTIRSVSGSELTVDPALFDGYVERAARSSDGAVIGGWAVTRADGQPAKEILVFSGGRLLRVVEPSRERPDVVSAVGSDSALLSGFRVVVPAEEVDRQTGRGGVRVFAVGDSGASELRHLR
jgi:hypothetical protein